MYTSIQLVSTTVPDTVLSDGYGLGSLCTQHNLLMTF